MGCSESRPLFEPTLRSPDHWTPHLVGLPSHFRPPFRHREGKTPSEDPTPVDFGHRFIESPDRCGIRNVFPEDVPDRVPQGWKGRSLQSYQSSGVHTFTNTPPSTYVHTYTFRRVLLHVRSGLNLHGYVNGSSLPSINLCSYRDLYIRTYTRTYIDPGFLHPFTHNPIPDRKSRKRLPPHPPSLSDPSRPLPHFRSVLSPSCPLRVHYLMGGVLIQGTKDSQKRELKWGSQIVTFSFSIFSVCLVFSVLGSVYLSAWTTYTYSVSDPLFSLARSLSSLVRPSGGGRRHDPK